MYKRQRWFNATSLLRPLDKESILKEEGLETIPEQFLQKTPHKTEDTPHKETPKQSNSNIIEIDLHIDKLLDDTTGMANKDMLDYQMDVFHKTLEQYKLRRGQKIVFIHGKGAVSYTHLSMGTERDKTKTAYYILNNYVKNKDPRNHIFILHRLDKETSGVMMFAKNKKVQEILQKNWNEMIRERKYVAVIEGCPQPEQGQVKSYISENKALIVHSLSLIHI